MAAVRARQAAYRLASTLASSASAGSAGNRTAAMASRTRLAASAGSEAGCVAALEALKERAPHRPPGGGEAGGALPVWAAMLEGRLSPLGHATTPLLAESGYHEVLRQVSSTLPGCGPEHLATSAAACCFSLRPQLPPAQLGPDGLRPLPAGEVKVHWILPGGSADDSEKLMFEAPFRQEVNDSVQAVGKALWQEAESTGSGKRELVSEPLRGSGFVGLWPCLPVALSPGLQQATAQLAEALHSTPRASALQSVCTSAQHLYPSEAWHPRDRGPWGSASSPRHGLRCGHPSSKHAASVPGPQPRREAPR